MTSSIVLTPKVTFLRGNTSFAPSVKVGQTVRPGRVPEKNGQDSDSAVVAVPDVITCAKFGTEIFRSYGFTGSGIFDFPIDSCMDLTTVQQPVIFYPRE